jgi:hypothetical protein
MRCVALLSLLAVAAFADDSELVQASKRARSAKGKPHTTITNKDRLLLRRGDVAAGFLQGSR